jgi:phosphate-selective porin OprO/OprP
LTNLSAPVAALAQGIESDERKDPESGILGESELESEAVPEPGEMAAAQPSPRPGDSGRPASHGWSGMENYVESLLVRREMPVLKIGWGGQVLVDAPLNGEPDDAQVVLRSGQIHFSRLFRKDWFVKVTLDYNNAGNFELADNYISYTGWKTGILKLGVFDPPFSLESVSKTTAITFMERALPVAALSERRSAGIGLLKRTPKSILNAGLFVASPQFEGLSDNGQALVLHYVHSPITFLGRENVHVGGSLSYRVNTNDVQYRSKPEVATTDDYYVDTGVLGSADQVIRLGFEASKVDGRHSWQSEILATRVDGLASGTARFWGAYAFYSYFLTNDSRNFNGGSGKFYPVVPNSPLFKGGKGAFELAVRASYVDLNDKSVFGGAQSDVSLGLNWYLNGQFRLMTNLVKVLDVNRPDSEFDGQDPLIFSLRLQWSLE